MLHPCIFAVISSILFKWLILATHSLIVGAAGVLQCLVIDIHAAERRKGNSPFLASLMDPG